MTIESFFQRYEDDRKTYKRSFESRIQFLSLNCNPSSLGPNAETAIRCENSFDAEEWRTFCRILSEAQEDSTIEIMSAISMACSKLGTWVEKSRNCSWAARGKTYCSLKGPQVKSVKKRLMCRVIHIYKLADEIAKIGVPTAPYSKNLLNIREVLTKHPEKQIGPHGIWSEAALGNYFVWSTFDEDGKRDTPLPLRKSSAKFTKADMGSSLGLPRNYVEKKGPLVAIGFRLSKLHRPTKPTIGHAYAGPGWNYYFRPNYTQRKEKWGRTIPWEVPEQPGQPEIVHELVTLGDCITSPNLVFFD